MIIFIESLVVISIIYIIYISMINNNIPKSLGIIILVVGFFVLPSTIKSIILLSSFLLFIIFQISKKFQNDSSSTL
jgi:hypothetical protein